jgi:geranylgeranyl diphosphate synthase type II
MIAGQVLDLEAVSREEGRDLRVEDLEAVHRRKTGALFRSSLRLGAYAAGAGPEALAAIDDYAAAFGLAFQIADDLLDVESTSDKTGKRVGKDAARGKLTYPGLIGVAASRQRATELGHDAVAAAERFGPGGQPLARLARFAVERDR